MSDRPDMIAALVAIVAFRAAACAISGVVAWRLRDVGRIWVFGHAALMVGMLLSIEGVIRALVEIGGESPFSICILPIISSFLFLLGTVAICRGVLRITARGTESLPLLKAAHEAAFREGQAKLGKRLTAWEEKREDHGEQ